MNTEFQNGYLLGLASGGVINIGNDTPILDYTVTFVVSDETYESISVKSGHSIQAPYNTPIHDERNFVEWVDKDGKSIIFPYVVNDNITFMAAFSETYVSRLYNHFDINKDEYPYVIIGFNSSNATVNFAQTTTGNTINKPRYYGILQNHSFKEYGDLNAAVNYIINNIASLEFKETGMSMRSFTNLYTNFDIDFDFTGTAYRL